MTTNAIVSKFYRTRSTIWMRGRLLFPSPAEVKFIQVMGGRVLTLRSFKSTKTGFPLTLILSLGSILKAEMMRREVRIGKYYVDFGNDINRGIEIDGDPYHMDILKQQKRDRYCAGFGWLLLHIRAVDLWRKPNEVRERVVGFLTK